MNCFKSSPNRITSFYSAADSFGHTGPGCGFCAESGAAAATAIASASVNVSEAFMDRPFTESRREYDSSAVRRDTLIDFFDDLARARGDFLVHDDGFRSRTFTYAEVGQAARGFAARLHQAGITQGDKVIFFSENRPEWIVAFWGCLLAGVIVVPIDYRSSPDFLARVARIVSARLVLVGQDVPPIRDTAGAPAWALHELDWADGVPPPVTIAHEDLAEIIFTSGATAEPKGVLITHANILANIVPVEREVIKYRKWGRPFFPLRFLNLLPLSHMFGQAMATFVPPMLPGVVMFMRGYNPGEIAAHIRNRRISVLVSVPKILDVLREHVHRLAAAPPVVEASVGAPSVPPPPAAAPSVGAPSVTPPSVAAPPLPRGGQPASSPSRPNGAPKGNAVLRIARRWWRYRAVHRHFGWKFWAFVVGAAPLDPELEAFWGELGFAVIQGYGLTETAPIVTLNHPFGTRRGSVGKAIAGVEVKIAPDGEILVRGENVTKGYFGAEDETARAFADGWFHTGDIGEIGDNGQLFIRGRKKEMIVTPEGLNVFPEDVERVLNQLPGVRDSAVVGVPVGGEERVHGVLVLDPGADPDAIARDANARLADHQKIRRALVWPEPELPRTEGTRKLKRSIIRDWVKSGGPPPLVRAGADALNALLAKYSGRADLSPVATIDELGLSSLERVELMVALEDAFQTRIDEGAFAEARSVSELRSLIERGAAADVAPAETVDFPEWNRWWPARAIRRVSLAAWLLPLTRVFAWIRVEGRERLAGIDQPVIFAVNHQSHMDVPVVMAALPPPFRYRVAPAMMKEFFKPYFFPEQHGRFEWLVNTVLYYLAALFFNAFPLPQREAGARQTLRYIGEVLEDGFSVLIFPEGRRSDTGEVGAFRPGIGMIASRLGVPVVPVRTHGLEHVLPPSWHMARPGRVRVVFGAPLKLSGDDYEALARQVEDAVRRL
jgi:long-chain acyl-CoA synthetase